MLSVINHCTILIIFIWYGLNTNMDVPVPNTELCLYLNGVQTSIQGIVSSGIVFFPRLDSVLHAVYFANSAL